MTGNPTYSLIPFNYWLTKLLQRSKPLLSVCTEILVIVEFVQNDEVVSEYQILPTITHN